MKIVDVEQGSKEWLSWRKTVITATECSIIMGSNPWDTPYTCWGRKLGLIPEKQSNEAMERGKRLEPIARERFIKKQGINMTPVCVESTENDFLGASLDGLSDCNRYILEVKTGGQKLLDLALKGEIPAYYMHQMQHQLLVTGAEHCFYKVAHEDEEKEIVIPVFPDPLFAETFMPKAREFWRCVAFREPPPLQEKDYKDMSEDWDWQSWSVGYKEIDAQIKTLEEKKEEYRKRLIGLCQDQNCAGNGIKIMKTTTKGRIAYDDIPEIKGLDLEKYRKPPANGWKIISSEKKDS